jgi:hypothetical protein
LNDSYVGNKMIMVMIEMKDKWFMVILVVKVNYDDEVVDVLIYTRSL